MTNNSVITTRKKKNWKDSRFLPFLTFIVLVLIFAAGAVFLYFEQSASSQQVADLEKEYKTNSSLKQEKQDKVEETEGKSAELGKKLKKVKKEATDTEFFDEENN